MVCKGGSYKSYKEIGLVIVMNRDAQEKFKAETYLPKAKKLLQQMTLLEKIGQLTLFGSLKEMKMNYLRQGLIGGLLNVSGADQVNSLQKIAVEETRLGIPLLIGDDVIHGYRTTFPIPLASAASFDMEKIELAESVAAKEAYACGINWIYAPMVDITREPRWGRVAEGAGEDTYLGCCVAKARVKGLQTLNPKTGLPYAAACPKHFAGYGLAEGGRDYDACDISEHTLFSTYMPPYESAINAGAMSIMSSFNTLNGEPVSGSKRFLTDVLRNKYGFEGMVVSDWESIMELIFHRVAADRKDAARIAVKAGNDMDMHSGVYMEHMQKLVEEEPEILDFIDQSVLRILSVKYALGLFENPYRDAAGESILLNSGFRAIARDVARSSMVLLKNNERLLPLKKGVKVFLTGPLADSREDMVGMWRCKGNPVDVITVKDALPEALYIKGCDIEGGRSEEFEKAIKLAADCDVIVYACGEPESWTGEIHCKTDISLPGIQNEYARLLKETGKPLVALLMVGRPVACTELDEISDAILLGWHPGIEAGNAVCDCLFGDYSPAGKLPMTFPRTTGQIPIFYSHLSSGRPYENFQRYIDSPVTPLYPFGYGLTYSPITYSNLTIENPTLKDGQMLKFRVDVSNTGDMDTEEVVQVYFKDLVSSVATPERKLCDFKKILIKAGSSITLDFSVPSEAFAFLNFNLEKTLEKGEFQLFVGSDSTCDYSANFYVE